jgi:ubiquinone/menaquinone biosynthesis C-methylase UbiE
MRRIPEPELIINSKPARSHAQADFAEAHNLFMRLLVKNFPQDTITGPVLDLGCGTADITRRFAQTFTKCQVDGIDSTESMLKYGQRMLEKYGLTHRVHLKLDYLPEADLPLAYYKAVISNSLLHHLANPLMLWTTIKRVAQRHSPIFIMDLMRPESLAQAEIIVQRYVGSEPDILQQDFYNSLLAAYRIDEVEAQLQRAALNYLRVHEVSDRHFIVVGRLSSYKDNRIS